MIKRAAEWRQDVTGSRRSNSAYSGSVFVSFSFQAAHNTHTHTE